MKQIVFAFTLLALIGSSILGSAQQSTTVWTPRINYSLTYAQDIKLNFGNVTLDQANLPTSFNVTDMNNTGYRYILQGDPNQKEKSVNMQIMNIPNFGTFELPTGDLPIFLPLSFNGKEDWMDSFGSQLQVLGGLLNSLNESAIFSSNITITNSAITFSLISKFDELTLANVSDDISSYLDFLPQVVFDQDVVFRGVEFFTNITYSKTSGIMDSFVIDLHSDNSTVNNVTYVDQSIFQNFIFAAVLPPFGSTGIIDTNFPFLMSLLIVPISVSFRKIKKKTNE